MLPENLIGNIKLGRKQPYFVVSSAWIFVSKTIEVQMQNKFKEPTFRYFSIQHFSNELHLPEYIF